MQQQPASHKLRGAEAGPLTLILVEHQVSNLRAGLIRVSIKAALSYRAVTAARLCWQTGKTDLVRGEGGRENISTELSERIPNAQSSAAVIYFASCQTRTRPCPGIRLGSPTRTAAPQPVPTVLLIILCFKMPTSKQVIPPSTPKTVSEFVALGYKNHQVFSLAQENK